MTIFKFERKCINRILIFSVFLLALPSLSFAQKEWVKDAILRSKSATVDPKASALILVKDHSIQIYDNGKTKKHVKIATKMLNSNGEAFMSLTESITSWRKIKSVKGWHIKADGKVVKLKKDNIIQVAQELTAGYYDDVLFYIAEFIDVKVGDIVAFEYTLTEKSNWDSYYQAFYMQVQQPVLYANYHVKIPKGWDLHIGSHFADVCTFEQVENEYNWKAENLAFQPEEKLMPPWYYMTRYIKISCYDPLHKQDFNFVDWKDASVWVKNNLSPSVDVNLQIEEYVAEHINILPDNESKLKAISEFVPNEIRYVAVEIGKGRFVPRKATRTFFNRYGDCKDKVTLMRSMLQVANIPSVSVLASVHGYVDSLMPSPLQFDHCILGIPVDSIADVPAMPNATVNGWLLFDPTDPSVHLGELPMALYGSKVLIAEEIDSSLIPLQYISPENNHRKFIVNAHLDENGNMTSDVTIKDYGAPALLTSYWHSKNKPEDIKKRFKALFSELLPLAEFSEFNFESNTDSSTFKFRLKQDSYLIKSGDLRFLLLDFVYSGRLPQLKKKKRLHPIWFGSFKKLELEINWTVDEAWDIELTADSMETKNEVVTFNYNLSKQDNRIQMYSLFTSTGKLIDKEKYSEARKFRRKFTKVRSMKIMLKNKSE